MSPSTPKPTVELSAYSDFSQYVVHLQLHMTLQARRTVSLPGDIVYNQEQIPRQTQTNLEKLVSRWRI